MSPEQAWSVLERIQGNHSALKRWTKDGATGEEFSFRVGGGAKGPSIAFFRGDQEVKSASFERFANFFESWRQGARDPEQFRNGGPKGTKAEVIHFLLPVFERLGLERVTEPSGGVDVRRLMAQVTVQDVRAALTRIDAGEKGLFADSTRYDLMYEGRRYPPKRVLGLALEAVSPDRKFTPYDFKGGDLSSCFQTLLNLGFEIEDKKGVPLPDAPRKRKSSLYPKPAWELSLDAVHALGGKATRDQVEERILERVPNFNVGNVDPDLNLLSVNSSSRGNYGPNEKPRRTDEGNPYDALYVLKEEDGAVFSLYDPEKHGVWELVQIVGDDKLRPRLVSEESVSALLSGRSTGPQEPFDPTNRADGRARVAGEIYRRRGQAKFRKELLEAYGSRCCVTGCDAEDALEAAHILSYLGPHTNHVTNGLLLRADVHTLFDLGLLWFDVGSSSLVISDKLSKTEYQRFTGVKFRLPMDKRLWPSMEALRIHAQECSSNE